MILAYVRFNQSNFLCKTEFIPFNLLFSFYNNFTSFSYYSVSKEQSLNLPSFLVVITSDCQMLRLAPGSITSDSTADAYRIESSPSPLYSNFQSTHFIQPSHLSQLKSLSIFFLWFQVKILLVFSFYDSAGLMPFICSKTSPNYFVIQQHLSIVLIETNLLLLQSIQTLS